MKKIETVTMVEKKNIQYQALDGTLFFDEEECKKYDNSAKCVIRARLLELATKHTNAYGLFPGGSEDYEAFVVTPTSDHDIDTVRQFMSMVSLKYNPDYEPTITKDDKGKTLVIIVGYDEDWVEARYLDQIIFDLTGKHMSDDEPSK